MTTPRRGVRGTVARLGLALLCVAATRGAHAAPPAVEDPARALARLDSLQSIVRIEEARVRKTPGDEAGWDRLARAWFQVGDHEKAARSLERARAMGARTYDTQLLSGRVARSEGRFGEAIEWLQRAVRAKPDDWEAHEDLGLALYMDGRLREAADLWERARALPGSGSPERAGLLAALRRVRPRAYTVRGRGRERLPFATGQARGAWVVSARLQGRGPFLMRIDTGSPEAVLGRSLARELGLATEPGGASGASVGEQAVRLDYAVLDSLTLGGTTVGALPVAISDHPGLGDSTGVRGTLGFEVLRRFRFMLDFPDSALVLEPLPASTPTRPAAPGAERAPAADTTRPAWIGSGGVAHRLLLVIRGTHLLVVPGRVGGGPERPFVLDTGAPGIALAAPMSTLAEAGIAVDTSRVLSGASAAGAVDYYAFDVPRLCVGSACRDSLRGTYGIFPPRLERNVNFRVAGLVSQGFLSRYRLAVDLGRHEVWLIEP